MKVSKLLILTAIIPFLAVTSCKTSQPSAEKQAKQTEMSKKIVDQEYKFSATSAMPMGGRTIMLSGSDYTLTVSKDKVIAYLPYFGRAYSAPMGNSDGGIKFTSTKFEYTSVSKKPGNWEITIKPKDGASGAVLFLSMNDNGFGTVSYQDNDRQSISFNGTVE